MLARKCFNSINRFKSCLCGIKTNTFIRIYSSKGSDKPEESENTFNQTLGKISSKYKIFKDSDSAEIPDVYEENLKYSNLLEEEPHTVDPFLGLNLQRGLNGVFEIEDLIDVLKRDNGEDIFVTEVPRNIKYVDYICIVTGKSYRHMQAIAQFVRRVYKQKRHKGDIIPQLEGKDSKEWMALDLGNIALHIFSREARKKYDLDMLWAVGPKYDTECNKEDPIVEMLEKHSIYLKDLQPAS